MLSAFPVDRTDARAHAQHTTQGQFSGKRWASELSESASAREYFIDLCRMLSASILPRCPFGQAVKVLQRARCVRALPPAAAVVFSNSPQSGSSRSERTVGLRLGLGYSFRLAVRARRLGGSDRAEARRIRSPRRTKRTAGRSAPRPNGTLTVSAPENGSRLPCAANCRPGIEKICIRFDD